MSNISARLQAIRGLNPLADEERARVDIRNAKQGSYLEYEGRVYEVRRVFRYLDVKWKNFARRKNNYWVTELELFSLKTGQISYLEWEQDDELEIYLTTAEVKLRDIRYQGAAIRHRDLEQIADQEQGELRCAGKTFDYSDDDSWAALFYTLDAPVEPGNLSDGMPLRIYEFEASDGSALSIEAWYDGEPDDGEKPDREAFLSRKMTPQSIAMLQV